MTMLAVDGGNPVRAGRPWPAWPQTDTDTEAQVLAAVRSHRWTVSRPSEGEPALERVFAERFAAYNGVPYCVSVDHGSGALVVGLEALDIGPGDEVIVPAVTWVATASAVLRVGALPVFADVDPLTGCLTAESVRAVLSERTRAVIVVHLACTVADLDALLEVTEEAGVPLFEDCAQAHGALWRGKPVGGWGAVGAFSFQGGKVLTGAEGGAVIMSDPQLFHRAQQLRADSRRYKDGTVVPGEMEIVEDGQVMGANYCLSELHAAVLCDQLDRLEAQHEWREKQVQLLEQLFLQLGGFATVPMPEGADRRSIYEYAFSFVPGTFGNQSIEKVAEALTAELGLAVYPPDAPLYRSVLFRPETKRRFSAVWTPEGRRRSIERDFPGSEAYCASTLLFHHSALLGGPEDVEDIARALAKVRDVYADR